MPHLGVDERGKPALLYSAAAGGAQAFEVARLNATDFSERWLPRVLAAAAARSSEESSARWHALLGEFEAFLRAHPVPRAEAARVTDDWMRPGRRAGLARRARPAGSAQHPPQGVQPHAASTADASAKAAGGAPQPVSPLPPQYTEGLQLADVGEEDEMALLAAA